LPYCGILSRARKRTNAQEQDIGQRGDDADPRHSQYQLSGYARITNFGHQPGGAESPRSDQTHDDGAAKLQQEERCDPRTFKPDTAGEGIRTGEVNYGNDDNEDEGEGAEEDEESVNIHTKCDQHGEIVIPGGDTANDGIAYDKSAKEGVSRGKKKVFHDYLFILVLTELNQLKKERRCGGC